jgi:hypothetical protein
MIRSMRVALIFSMACVMGCGGSDAASVTLDVPIDWRVFGFTAALAFGATLLLGLTPVLGLGAVEPNEALQEQSRTISGDRRTGLRSALVVTQTFASDEEIQVDARIFGVGAAAVAIALRAPIIVAMAIAGVVTALLRLAV